MQYELALPFFAAVSTKMSHDKAGIGFPTASSPSVERSRTETAAREFEWLPSDAVGAGERAIFSNTVAYAGASSRQPSDPGGLKLEPMFRLAQDHHAVSDAFRPTDDARRLTNAIWATNGGGFQQDGPWHARQDFRAVSLHQAPACSDQMGFTSSSGNNLACLGTPWLPTDSGGAMPSFPISSADITPLMPVVSSSAAALFNPGGVPESDLFVNAFEGVPMPLGLPRAPPLSPVRMENFPPFLATCETATVTVEGDENLPTTFGTWDSRSSPDSACTYNLAFRFGSFSSENGKLPDSAGGPGMTAWMAPHGNTTVSEAQSARSPMHSSLRRRPRSEIITEADYSGCGQHFGEESMPSHARSASPSSRRVVRSMGTSAMRQVAGHSTSCISPAVISSRPLPVTAADCKVAHELATNRQRGGGESLEGSVKLQLLTQLNDCYWKNGRKNLQCFPACPEHSDFYSMKMNNRKHSAVGVCRGPVYCHVFTTTSGQQVTTSGQQVTTSGPSSTGLVNGLPGGGATNTTVLARHMKYELGVGASSSGGGIQELFVLGRFERVPQHHESASHLLDLLPPPPTFDTSVGFEQFRYSCFQAVEMEERRVLVPATCPDSGRVTPISDGPSIVRSTWFFLPDVWKVRPMLKKKRKATRSAPAQTFPFCFRVFVYVRAPPSDGADCGQRFECLAETTSSFFELYSTRTVDRVKRRVWGGASSTDSNSGNGVDDTAMPPTKRHATCS